MPREVPTAESKERVPRGNVQPRRGRKNKRRQKLSQTSEGGESGTHNPQLIPRPPKPKTGCGTRVTAQWLKKRTYVTNKSECLRVPEVKNSFIVHEHGGTAVAARRDVLLTGSGLFGGCAAQGGRGADRQPPRPSQVPGLAVHLESRTLRKRSVAANRHTAIPLP